MPRKWKALLLGLGIACSAIAADRATFDASGQLEFPGDYRDWIFLSSGLGMTYGPAARQATAQQPIFDNVFVNPPAWAEFKKSGRWPEGTTFILELRYSTSHGSINQGGHFQTDVAAVEAAVKDTKRFPNGWGYFTFGGGLMQASAAAKALPAKSTCQACHQANGAVEQTFVQFYPAALEVAKREGTVRPGLPATPPSPVGLFHRLRDTDTDATAALRELKSMDAEAAVFSEANLNMLGYRLLTANRFDASVAVLQWAAEGYPKSANVRDSLAEALEKAGKAQEALRVSRQTEILLDGDKSLSDTAREEIRKANRERIARLGPK